MNPGAAAWAAPHSPEQPALDAPLATWVAWFWANFLPDWISRAADTDHGGFVDRLDGDGAPDRAGEKTILAQARLLYTFAHLARQTADPAHIAAAQAAHGTLGAFRKAPGLFRRAIAARGTTTGRAEDEAARSYDQAFVILALSTWNACDASPDLSGETEACWNAIETHLTDPATGLLLEDDTVLDPASGNAPNRGQNPHMHLYEAALQVFEMSGEAVWLTRARRLRALALDHFFDETSGTIREFLAPDLSSLPGPAGLRREIGHQCEWAWLLDREAELARAPLVSGISPRLRAFADRHGYQARGAMAGAALDAVAADTGIGEQTFLLWPQTEAIKDHAIRFLAGDAESGIKARAILALVFARYFAGRAAFCNQLDADGKVIWPDCLSRLLYHLVLALTEGARAGLWPGPTRHKNGGV